MKSQDYLRQVFAHIVAQSDESSTVLQDIQGDDLEAMMRRGAMDGIINVSMPKEAQVLIDAMRIAGVTAEQCATVINMTAFKAGRS